MKQVGALVLAVIVAATVSIDSAQAGERGKAVNKHQAHQKERIHQGVKSGEVTRQEASKLRQNQRQINRAEDRAKADGKIGPAEAARLKKLQQEQNQAIYRQKHDNQDRPKADNSSTINGQQDNQKDRIQQGIKSGELTKKEATRLRENQVEIKQLEAKMRQGGLTPAERARLDSLQDRQSQAIYNQKHDDQDRPGADQPVGINDRQDNQKDRIQGGIKSGELTKAEAVRLRENQAEIKQLEAKLRRGGLSPAERARLDNLQDKQSKAIYTQKHDEQDHNPN